MRDPDRREGPTEGVPVIIYAAPWLCKCGKMVTPAQAARKRHRHGTHVTFKREDVRKANLTLVKCGAA